MAPNRGALAGPRVLLRKLREVMAEPIGAQQRLDKVVTLIAANMVAEVCSVYVLRADNVLELYATEGLKASSVHRASLTVGRGLVGTDRRRGAALNLPDAQSHPALRLPAGDGRGDLPLLPRRAGAARRAHARRAGRAEPLLPHLYGGGAGGAADDRHGARRDVRVGRDGRHRDPRRRPRRQPPGASEGRRPTPKASRSATSCCMSRASSSPSSSPRTSSTSCVASMRRWRACKLSVDDLLARGAEVGAGEHREILEAYKMFAEDRGWTRRLQEAIKNGLTAEAAVERVQNDTRAQMARQTDPFLRDRLHDFDDLANRLLRELMGRPHGPFAADLPERRHHRGAAHGAGGAARLRPREAARAGARGGRTDEPCRDRGARARHRHRRAARRHRVAGGGGRSDHRRRRHRRGASPAAGRHRDRLCRQGALPRPQAGAVPAGQERAGGDARRGGDRAQHQCRAAHGHAAPGGIGRRRRRALPHRAAVHGGVALSAPEGAGGLLSAGARRGQRQARHLPLARCRRRQGAPVLPPAEGGEPGDGLAGDPARPRPAGAAPHAGARAAQGGGGTGAPPDVPDGHRGGGVRARQGDRRRAS